MAELCTIGPGVVVNGRITGEEDVCVQGRVEGTVVLDAHLIVEADGEVVADLEVQSVAVHGTFNGNVVAQQVVTLHPGCAVTGNLRAPRIIIEEGARFRGNIDMDVNLPE